MIYELFVNRKSYLIYLVQTLFEPPPPPKKTKEKSVDDSIKTIIGMTPLEVCEKGLASLANQMIDEGKIHICGSQIINGPSKISPPLKISPCSDNESLAQFLSQE